MSEKKVNKIEEKKGTLEMKETEKLANVKSEKKGDAKEEKSEVKNEKQVKSEKKEEKKIKKDEAIARGVNMRFSKKHGMYICTFIKNEKIDDAISLLEDVKKFKKAVPFKGEIPHRKGKIMSGRYPIKASIEFVNILKALKGNAIVNGLDLDKTSITHASANWGVRPMRRNNRRGKRTHVLLKAKELSGGKK